MLPHRGTRSCTIDAHDMLISSWREKVTLQTSFFIFLCVNLNQISFFLIYRQTSTDDQLEHMNEAAVDLVSKLIEEPHQPPPPPPPPPIAQLQQQYHVPQAAPVSVPPSQNDPYGVDKWYYRDPQGEVQGNFL